MFQSSWGPLYLHFLTSGLFPGVVAADPCVACAVETGGRAESNCAHTHSISVSSQDLEETLTHGSHS